jgi:hypothetical protein
LLLEEIKGEQSNLRVKLGEHKLIVASAYLKLCLINLSLLLIAVALDEEVEVLH